MDKNRPVYEERLGNIRLSIWANSNERGTYHNVNIVRKYRDADGVYRDTNTFTGLADLALVAEATRIARDFIANARRFHMDEINDDPDL